MKLSICNIAWQQELDDEMYQVCKDMGYSGIEIAPSRILGDMPYQNPNEGMRFQDTIKSKYNLEVVSLQSIWYGQEGLLFKEDYEKLCDYTHEAIRFAGYLKVNNVVFGSPKMRKVFQLDDYRKGIEFFSKAAEWAEEYDTTFSIEANPMIYGTNYINYTLEAMAIVKYINSKHLRVNLDIGTIISNKEEIEEIADNIELINHVHISEPNLELIQVREIHKAIFKILRTEGYQGYISIEMKQQNINAIKKIMKYIKTL